MYKCVGSGASVAICDCHDVIVVVNGEGSVQSDGEYLQLRTYVYIEVLWLLS